jgi:hypothetical protein
LAETAVTSNLGWDNFFSTTTTGALTATTTTIPLATPPTPTEGFLVLDPGGANEIIFYNSVSGNNVIVPTTDDRGRGDSTAQSHSSGITVKMNTVGMMFEALQSGLGLSATFNLPAGVVKNADLATSTGELGAAWASWTPTLSGRFDDAKWTKTCRYIQIGKTVHFTFKIVASTTTPMSGGTTDAIFTLPVTAATGYTGTDQNALIGTGGIYDSGTALYQATVGMNSSNYTSARIRFAGGSGGLEAITSTAPMTWTTSDEITVTGTYEAA